MLRVLTLSTLFPDATRPNFGVFVARQVAALSRRDGVAVRVVAPLGLPLWPLSRHPRYRGWDAVPRREVRDGVTVDRPRFRIVPGTGGRFHVAALTRALVPLLDSLRADFPFDVIDASFFFPDGPAAVALSRRYGVPVSIKARGADIHHWGHAPATAAQVRAAGRAADGLLAVSAAMRDDMAAIGIPAERVRVHHTGVDLTRFAPAGDRDALRASLGIAGPLVLSVGALIPRKGHDVAIAALARLPGATLAIAGEGWPIASACSARSRMTICRAGSPPPMSWRWPPRRRGWPMPGSNRSPAERRSSSPTSAARATWCVMMPRGGSSRAIRRRSRARSATC